MLKIWEKKVECYLNPIRKPVVSVSMSTGLLVGGEGGVML